MINPKKLAAEEALRFVKDGMVVGLGTGSTAYWAILGLAEKQRREELRVLAIASSRQSEKLASESGIKVLPLDGNTVIDLTIDGADEVDPHKNLIKGGGGALLREKIVAYNSRQLIIIVDETKWVSSLGRFPLPVEVATFGWERTMTHLAALGSRPQRRLDQVGSPFVTDNGHYLLDCFFGNIPDPAALNQGIKSIPGVMETGLFLNMAHQVVVGYTDGTVKVVN